MKLCYFISIYIYSVIIFDVPYSRGCLPCAKDKVGKSLMPLFEQINTDPKMFGHFYTTEAPIASGWKPQRFVQLPLFLSPEKYNAMAIKKDSASPSIITHNIPKDAAVLRIWTSDGRNNYSHSWDYSIDNNNISMHFLTGTESKLYATLLTRDGIECSTKLVVDGANATAVARTQSAAEKCIMYCKALQCVINIDWNYACDKIRTNQFDKQNTTPIIVALPTTTVVPSTEDKIRGSLFEKQNTAHEHGFATTTTVLPLMKDDVNHSMPIDDGLTRQLLMIGCPVIVATAVIIATVAACKIRRKRQLSVRQEASKSLKNIQNQPLPTVPKDRSCDYENFDRANEYCEIEYSPRYVTKQSRDYNSPLSSNDLMETTLNNVQENPQPVTEAQYENLCEQNEYNEITYTFH